jgi:hypothetical protein
MNVLYKLLVHEDAEVLVGEAHDQIDELLITGEPVVQDPVRDQHLFVVRSAIHNLAVYADHARHVPEGTE